MRPVLRTVLPRWSTQAVMLITLLGPGLAIGQEGLDGGSGGLQGQWQGVVPRSPHVHRLPAIPVRPVTPFQTVSQAQPSDLNQSSEQPSDPSLEQPQNQQDPTAGQPEGEEQPPIQVPGQRQPEAGEPGETGDQSPLIPEGQTPPADQPGPVDQPDQPGQDPQPGPTDQAGQTDQPDAAADQPYGDDGSTDTGQTGGDALGEYDRPASFPSLSQQSLGNSLGSASSISRGVTGNLFDTPSLATIVNQQEIAERAAVDLFQALQTEVGVQVQRTARGQAAPFIRGLTGQQTLILIDGIRLNNSTFRAGPNQYFNTIDPGMVERIEVVRGPGSVLWGSDAIGGVINIVTRTPEVRYGDYGDASFRQTVSTADFGSYSRANLDVSLRGSGIFGGASFLNINDVDTAGPLNVQDFTAYQQYAGDLKFVRQVGRDRFLTVALQHFVQEDLPRSDRFSPFIPEADQRPTFFDPQQRNLAYIRFHGYDQSHAAFDDFAFTASYARQREATTVEDLRAGRDNFDVNEFTVDTVGFILQLNKDIGPLGRLTYGAEWYHDEVDAFSQRFSATTGAFVENRTPQFPPDSFYEQVGAFLVWNVDLTERLNFIAGTRFQYIDVGATPIVDVNGTPTPVNLDLNFSDWIGSGALTFRLSEDIHLIGSLSEGFRAPNLDDLAATNTLVQQMGVDLPSPNLTPERSLTYELGVKVDRPRLRGQVFVFWNDLRDNILRNEAGTAPGTIFFSRDNRDSFVQGVESTGEFLLEDGWSIYGNYFYTFGKDREEQVPLSRIPPPQGILGLRWRSREAKSWFDIWLWMVHGQGRLAPRDFTDARISNTGNSGFTTLNFRTGTTLDARARHRVGLVVENITDRSYRVLGSGVDGVGFNVVLNYEGIR